MLKTVGFPSTRTGDQTIVDGNLVIGTAGKGIDFSATSHPAGMTSELLNDYEEGTWTPVANVITYAAGTSGFYTKIGRSVICTFTIVFPVTADTARAQIQALPFVSPVNTAATFGVYTSNFNGYVNAGNAIVTLVNETGTAFTTNAVLSGQTIYGTIVYSV